ncbi:unnamed protein product [Phyllotreta striolata]|uniref:Uncharacterized protein n=1 Tax=Phyllotreta striolata TaxID=444603 RepID=A0A9N9XQ41_PHYSR|nr:unnamed protein product [Phyllotreta striolata]
MNCLYRRPPCSPQVPCVPRPPCPPRPLPASTCPPVRYPCRPKTRMVRRCPSAEYPPCPRPRLTSRGCSPCRAPCPSRSKADVSINTCVPSYEADTFSSVMKKVDRFSCGNPECPAFPVCRHAKCCPACEATPKSPCYYPPTLPEPSSTPYLRFSSSSCGVPVKRPCGAPCRRKYQILSTNCDAKPPTLPCCYKLPKVCSRGCRLCKRCKRCMPPSCDPCCKLCPRCAEAKKPPPKPCDNSLCAKCAGCPPACKSCGDPCPKLCPGCAAAKKRECKPRESSLCSKCSAPPPVCKSCGDPCPKGCPACAAAKKPAGKPRGSSLCCKCAASASCPKLCAMCASCKPCPCKKPPKPCSIPDCPSSQECASEPCVVQKIYKTVFPPGGVTNYQQINIKVNQPPKGAPETRPLELPYRDAQSLHKCGGCGKLKLKRNPCKRQGRCGSGSADVFGPDPIFRIPAVQTFTKERKGAKVKRCLVC